ncbi:hypothetical protein GJ496_004793 [Pomphorhynchus laevis]|nr:hypothetical protein GJ496_004793 [Pomphorhynchus laevis]
MLSRMGIPKQIVSDYGQPFTSREFRMFCTDNGIHCIMTSPYHPQTNWFVERLVQTFKRRVDMSEGNLELTLAQFLMTYRNTKQSSTGVSPAVLMFGRRLSTIWDRLRPNHSNDSTIKKGSTEAT